MKKLFVTAALCLGWNAAIWADDAVSPKTHPDSSGWQNLFAPDLSDAIGPKGIWSVEDGVLTAGEDRCIWTQKQYGDCIIDLEFKNAPGTNSGVFVYGSDLKDTVPNSVEIQIADDFAQKWAQKPKSWHCAAIFGRLAPTKSAVKKPGQWNRMTITCQGPNISVLLNGELVTQIDMKQWTSAKQNPDGSEIPEWLSKPLAELPTEGHIGLQGKHAGAPIYFRNLRIKTLAP
ncbi:MAG: glycosyl hydrolase [Planctomycetes bacterium RBG_16_64_10]|nr:MAG: glycosyl hydrolase [Planctomycetes bacterium RBG_16_64_10]